MFLRKKINKEIDKSIEEARSYLKLCDDNSNFMDILSSIYKVCKDENIMKTFFRLDEINKQYYKIVHDANTRAEVLQRVSYFSWEKGLTK